MVEYGPRLDLFFLDIKSDQQYFRFVLSGTKALASEFGVYLTSTPTKDQLQQIVYQPQNPPTRLLLYVLR